MIEFVLHEIEIIKHFIHENHIFLPFFFPILAIAIISTLKFSIIPNKTQSLLEIIYEFLEEQMRALFHSDKDYKYWMPFFLSLFFYIFFSNILGIIPGIHSVTSNAWVTGSLAIVVILLSIFVGIKRKGLIKFFIDLTPSGIAWPMRVIMFPLELVSLISKPFSLAVRLYANMFAGHMVIKMLLFLTIMFHSFFIVPFDIIIVTIMMFFEIMVSVIQAFIFAYLSAIYITDNMYEGH